MSHQETPIMLPVKKSIYDDRIYTFRLFGAKTENESKAFLTLMPSWRIMARMEEKFMTYYVPMAIEKLQRKDAIFDDAIANQIFNYIYDIINAKREIDLERQAKKKKIKVEVHWGYFVTRYPKTIPKVTKGRWLQNVEEAMETVWETIEVFSHIPYFVVRDFPHAPLPPVSMKLFDVPDECKEAFQYLKNLKMFEENELRCGR